MSALLDDNSNILTASQLKAIEKLNELIKKDYPNINFQQDINFLTKYLYGNDWNAEVAVKKMVHCYQLKRDFPDWFASKKVSDYWPLIQTHSRYMLTDRDKNGRRIYVYKSDKLNTPGMNIKTSSQLDDMWFDTMLMDRATQCNGITVIVDGKHFPKSLLKWLIPKEIKVSAARAEICPCKNLDIHVVNIPSIVNIILKVVMPLMSDKLKSKIHFHQNDWTLLHESVGSDCLPEEYGGPHSRMVDYEKSYKFLLDKESILAENFNYGIIGHC